MDLDTDPSGLIIRIRVTLWIRISGDSSDLNPVMDPIGPILQKHCYSVDADNW